MRPLIACGFLLVGSSLLGFGATPDWQASLTTDPPGSFPELRPLRATYKFGWSGLTAATAEAHATKSEGRFALEGSGRTIGLARALWRFDVNFRALGDAKSLRPLESIQNETVRSKKTTTKLAFNDAGVTCARIENGVAKKNKDFTFSDIYDLPSALVYLRSQPLKDKSVSRVVVFPTSAPYLATITVTGREKISVRAGSYNAIKMDLQLSKVGKELDLQPHRKFRKATIWMSDDPDRLILRIEAQIFLGTIFAELQSVKFDNPKP